jgi:type I restriction enzyme, S subunit
LKNFIIPLPISIESQRSVVAELDSISKFTQRLESIYQNNIINLEELKKSVLQKAFAGEL